MDSDLIFVVGLLLGAFAIPSFVSAYADKRWPWMALVMALAAGGAIYHVKGEDPDRYTVAAVDNIVVEVLGRYIN